VNGRSTALLLIAIGLAAPALAQDGRGLDRLFGQIDADGNGEVTAEELTDARSRQFERTDTDGDGVVTLAELEAVQARIARFVDLAGAAPTERIRRQDKNGDGTLSAEEFVALPPFFALIDADGNGAISRAELERARAILVP
jgi:Ca2+-binding EF-hand superfamily protein